MDTVVHELKEALMKIEAFEALNDIDNRQLAVEKAVALAKYCDIPSGYRPLGNVDGNIIEDPNFPIPEWAAPIVAYIVLPTGEVAYFMKKHKYEWDGHTRPEKLSRIADFLNDMHTPMKENEDASQND
jgi:hypothetical protein